MIEQPTEPKKRSHLRKLLWLIVVVGIVVAVFVLINGQKLSFRKDVFHAVFLDNGQVYFGRLDKESRSFWKLTEVYYLRAGSLQAGPEQAENRVDLVKLGGELHAPKDEMIINPEHVVFYEEIGENSQIMKLIRGQ